MKAAQSGSLRAQDSLALMYYRKEDWVNALHWLQKAAKSRHPASIYQLGLLYFTDKAQSPTGNNEEYSFSLFLKSANSGDRLALFAVGLMLYRGLGTAPDREAARIWLGKSAAVGYAKAKKFLRDNF